VRYHPTNKVLKKKRKKEGGEGVRTGMERNNFNGISFYEKERRDK